MDEQNKPNSAPETAAPEANNTQPAAEAKEPISHAKTKRKGMPLWLRIIIVLVIIAVAVFVVLYATAWIAGFESISELLDYIWVNTKELFGKTQANTMPAVK